MRGVTEASGSLWDISTINNNIELIHLNFRAEKLHLRKDKENNLNILVTNDIVEEEEMKSNGNAFRVSLLIVAITVFII